MPKRSRQRSPRGTTGSNTYRFFVDPATVRGEQFHADDPQLLHQLTNVLRLEPGMSITVLDNSGSEYEVILEQVERREASGAITVRRPAAEPSLHLTLYLALLKGDRFEWVLQKGTELGVAAFVPILADHSVVDDATSIGAAKMERWERIIREAAEQSRRGRLPVLHPAQAFDAACQHAVARSRSLLLWEDETSTSLRAALRQAPAADHPALSLLSGPEGGWSAVEIQTATAYNVRCVSLGPRILRAETAPIVAISAAMFEYGDLDS